jgi:excisionase family DNA binding protein
MRTEVFDAAASRETDELLTTGEAAKMLNSSRQHIVDLCEQGLIPFTTVGTHRRVRRADVEAVRTRTERLTRDQRRSLWLAYAIAGRIVEDPDRAIELARGHLGRMRGVARGEAVRWLGEWERLLDRPIDDLLDRMTSRTLRGRELRQNSPFAGLLSEADRGRVLASWQAAEHQR